MFGSRASLDSPGDRNGQSLRLTLDDGTVVTDEGLLAYAPSYHLDPLAAELFGGERVATYQFEFNDTDSRLLALEYGELADCVQNGTQPEVTAEEGRADLALTYAPFESGVLGRSVSFEEVVTGQADAYQRDIDVHSGLVTA